MKKCVFWVLAVRREVLFRLTVFFRFSLGVQFEAFNTHCALVLLSHCFSIIYVKAFLARDAEKRLLTLIDFLFALSRTKVGVVSKKRNNSFCFSTLCLFCFYQRVFFFFRLPGTRTRYIYIFLL